jgi:hypothetical protein
LAGVLCWRAVRFIPEIVAAFLATCQQRDNTADANVIACPPLSMRNLFMHCRYNANAQDKRQARMQAFEAWETVTGNSMLERLAA